MAEKGDRPFWLVSEEDVMAHLFFAAAEIGEGCLEIAGVELSGTLSFPNSDTKTISFFSTGEVALGDTDTRVGSVVRLKYAQSDCAYSFLTELVEFADAGGVRQRWRLAFPRVVERNERRIVRRHRVMGRSGFSVSLDVNGSMRTLGLYDISAAGASFVTHPSQDKLKMGKNYMCTLAVPGCDSISVMFELRNMRPMPGDKERKLAGCRFVGLDPADHESLATSLSRLA
jgi:hypothetical protein